MAAAWEMADAYERYGGRWSRAVAPRFVRWLAVPPGRDWMDVGCGTGVLSAAILEHAEPASVSGVDPSPGFIAAARAGASDPRIRFEVGDAMALDVQPGEFDAVVAGLVLNFVPEPALALREMARVARPGGLVAAYVWDYLDGMQPMRRFWDVAGELDPGIANLAEVRRYPACRPGPLEELFGEAGLRGVETAGIEAPAVFRDFADYWEPFLGGQGTAPGYVRSLGQESLDRLREELRARLPIGPDGSIHLNVRAWAVKGVR